MLNLETLSAVKTILVHGGACPDGIASAILLHDALPEAQVRFIQYNSDEHLALEPGPGLLFADFTPKETRLQEFVEAGTIVLDHHKGARSIVAAFGENGRFGDEELDPGVCGAVLCYRHVWQPLLVHGGFVSLEDDSTALNFATLAGIRDTWQRKDPRWDEAVEQAEMLRFYPDSEWLGIIRPFNEHRNGELWAERRRVGKMLVQRHARAIKATLEKSWCFTSAKKTRVVMFEGTNMSSDASDALENADLVIGFGFFIESGVQKMVFSCRTRAGYDVLAFAKRFGGGGHSSAAGFIRPLEVTTPHPYQLAELLVNEHEGSQ